LLADFMPLTCTLVLSKKGRGDDDLHVIGDRQEIPDVIPTKESDV